MCELHGGIAFLGGLVASASLGYAASDPFTAPPKDAEFRWQAKQMLESLQMPSCRRSGIQAPRGFQRTELLKPEQEAVRKFEADIRGTPAELDFDIAKADAVLEVVKNDSCWAEYGNTEVASQHLKMTQDVVRASLERMQALAPSLHPLAVTSVSANDGAEFRLMVRNLIELSRPRCRQTVKAGNDAISSAARAKVSRFRQRLEHSAYATHFDVAEADVAYEYSIVRVECDDPGLASA